MYRTRTHWTRGLRLYRVVDLDEDADRPELGPTATTATPLHALSRFRSVSDPECFALYCVREGEPADAPLPFPRRLPAEDHTLVVVREFRRVPLDASGLALMLFTARPGEAARLIATLAHWAERAVSAYQPAYLLLAHSLEQPRVSVLLAGVHEGRALQGAWSSPLSIDLVLPEVGPMLEDAPERYGYCPEIATAPQSWLVSPHAV